MHTTTEALKIAKELIVGAAELKQLVKLNLAVTCQGILTAVGMR